MVEGAFHEKGPPYVRWAAEMAVGLQTGVPWIMCKQDDAPDPVVSFISSNHFYYDRIFHFYDLLVLLGLYILGVQLVTFMGLVKN